MMLTHLKQLVQWLVKLESRHSDRWTLGRMIGFEMLSVGLRIEAEMLDSCFGSDGRGPGRRIRYGMVRYGTVRCGYGTVRCDGK